MSAASGRFVGKPEAISEGRLRELLLFSPYEFDLSGTEIEHQQVIIGFEETLDKLKKGR
jgi:hypothetical protein